MKTTLRLLGISLIPAASGIFALQTCLLIAGETVGFQALLGAALVIYSAYAQDRIRGGKEDSVNRGELKHANRKVSLAFVLLLYLSSIIILYPEYLLPALVPPAVAYIYSRGLRIGKRKISIKKRFMAKNIVVASVWAYFISAFLNSLQMKITIFYFIFIKGFINTVIYDFRDRKGDSLAGIRTLPVCLGVKKTKAILLALHLHLHAGILILYLYDYWTSLTVMLLSFTIGLFYILYFSTSKERNNLLRDILVDWEWALILLGVKLLEFPRIFL